METLPASGKWHLLARLWQPSRLLLLLLLEQTCAAQKQQQQEPATRADRRYKSSAISASPFDACNRRLFCTSVFSDHHQQQQRVSSSGERSIAPLWYAFLKSTKNFSFQHYPSAVHAAFQEMQQQLEEQTAATFDSSSSSHHSFAAARLCTSPVQLTGLDRTGQVGGPGTQLSGWLVRENGGFQLSFSLLGRSKAKQQQQQLQGTQKMTEPSPAQTGRESSTPAACTFRLTFLGKQALNRPTNNTGFGSVQKPLRDIYLAAATRCRSDFWDATARRFQQESWPLDCVTYLDLVLFQTVKGRKRHFGYFRRPHRSDQTLYVVPDAVLIPLHKRDVKTWQRAREVTDPFSAFWCAGPTASSFLECHAYQVEDEATGRAVLSISSTAARPTRRAPSTGPRRKPLFNYAPRAEDRAGRSADAADGNLASISKWASQPALAPSPSATAAAPRRDLSASEEQQQEQQPEDRRYKSSGNLGISLMPATDGSFVVVDSFANDNNINSGHDKSAELFSFIFCLISISCSASSSAAAGVSFFWRDPALRLWVRFFEKYKELQAFNIPECEYMGFQEMQQQLEKQTAATFDSAAAVHHRSRRGIRSSSSSSSSRPRLHHRSSRITLSSEGREPPTLQQQVEQQPTLDHNRGSRNCGFPAYRNSGIHHHHNSSNKQPTNNNNNNNNNNQQQQQQTTTNNNNNNKQDSTDVSKRSEFSQPFLKRSRNRCRPSCPIRAAADAS
uniref:Myotubularin phosphatase domain-containing protein n=1 Tax=Macrostomum lignano TaxID=282301 RepID=A0A1I8JMM3_9PLAT